MDNHISVDVRRMLLLARKKLLLCVAAAVACGLLGVGAGTALVKPQYQGQIMFYVNNSAAVSQSVSASDIEASKNLADACGILLEAKMTLEEVNAHAGLSYSYEDLRQMITAEDVRSTELLRITVLCPTAKEADLLTESIQKLLPQRTVQVMEGVSLQVADLVSAGEKPVSSNEAVYALVGFLLGGALSVLAVLLWAAADQKLRMKEDVEMLCHSPVLELRGSGDSIFRAKLVHAVKDCPVLGLSSCGRISPTLAAALGSILAASGKQVLIVDTASRSEEVGLGEILEDRASLEESMCIHPEATACWYLPGGKTEVSGEYLGSDAMKTLLSMVKQKYDVVLLVLPERGHALSMAPVTDGFLLAVTREKHVRSALKTAVEDLEFTGGKVNAILLNDGQ